MAKHSFQPNPKVKQIFDDLDKYRQFCVDWGYKFDEAALYDMRNYSFQQYSKFVAHKNFKDGWADDAKKANPYTFED